MAAAVAGAVTSLGLLAAPAGRLVLGPDRAATAEGNPHHGEWDWMIALLQTGVVFPALLVVGGLLFGLPRPGRLLRWFGGGFLFAPLAVALLIVQLLYLQEVLSRLFD